MTSTATQEAPLSAESPPQQQQQAASPEKDPYRADLLSRIGAADEPGPFKGFIFGPEGVGKTVWCCRAKNCLLIDAEKGRRSLFNHPELLRDVRILKVSSFNDMEEVVWAIREGDIPGVETIIIDTMTTLVANALDEVMTKVAADNTNRSVHYPSQAERVLINSLVRKMVTAFTDLEQNLVLTAHQDWVKDEITGKMLIGPAVSPKIAQTLRGLVDFQGRMTADDMGDGQYVRWIQAHPTDRILAKCRIGGVPVQFDAGQVDINRLIELNKATPRAA